MNVERKLNNRRQTRTHDGGEKKEEKGEPPLPSLTPTDAAALLLQTR